MGIQTVQSSPRGREECGGVPWGQRMRVDQNHSASLHTEGSQRQGPYLGKSCRFSLKELGKPRTSRCCQPSCLSSLSCFIHFLFEVWGPALSSQTAGQCWTQISLMAWGRGHAMRFQARCGWMEMMSGSGWGSGLSQKYLWRAFHDTDSSFCFLAESARCTGTRC